MPWPLRPDEEVRAGAEASTSSGRVVAEVGEAEVRDDHGVAPQLLRTAWPPNWLRRAATAFIDGESSWRETKRAKIDALIVGTGTALIECLVDGPAALAGIFDVALDVVEFGVFLERLHEQLEQPASARRFRAATP